MEPPAFNAAVVNRFNKNDDGIDTETALRIAKLFKHKPTNIEHKKEKVVGHILTAGFSKYGSSEILTPDQLSNYNDPFNIALGAVVYKFVNKDFAYRSDSNKYFLSINHLVKPFYYTFYDPKI